MSSANKVLIIQTAFLGDAILISSLLEKMRIESPETIIHLLVRKGNESIFQAYPHANLAQVWAYDKKQKWASWRSLQKDLRAEKFDQVFVAQRFFGMGLLSLSIGAKKVIGFDKNPLSWFFTERVTHDWGNGKHETERNTALLSSWLGSKVYKPLCLSQVTMWCLSRIISAFLLDPFGKRNGHLFEFGLISLSFCPHRSLWF